MARLATRYDENVLDQLLFVPSVKPEQACTPGQPGIDVGGVFPWAGLAGMALLLVVGVMLWWKKLRYVVFHQIL